MKMIRNLVVIYLVTLSFESTGQTSGIEYYYDDAGNRVQRVYINLGQRVANDNDSIVDLKSDYTFILYPNTTETTLSILAEDKFLDLDSRKLSVYDLNGKVIESRDYIEQTEIIDLTNCVHGAYIVKVTAAGGYCADWRVIKQ